MADFVQKKLEKKIGTLAPTNSQELLAILRKIKTLKEDKGKMQKHMTGAGNGSTFFKKYWKKMDNLWYYAVQNCHAIHKANCGGLLLVTDYQDTVGEAKDAKGHRSQSTKRYTVVITTRGLWHPFPVAPWKVYNNE